VTTPIVALKRGMGLFSVVSTSTGLAFAAIEYLAAAALLSYVSGSLAWVSILVAGGMALLAWGFFSELNGLFPTAAAIRLYMRRSFDDRIALTVTFSYLTTVILVLAADAYIVGSAFTHVTGLPGWVTGVVICVLIGLAMVANLRGVQLAARLQVVATTLVIAGTVVVAGAALTRHRTAVAIAADAHRHHGVGAFVQAVALGVLLYSAFEWVTTSSEEVRRVADVPRGMLISLAVLALTCAAVAAGMGRLLSQHELDSAYPQLFLGRHALGQSGYVLMCGITLVTAVNTFNSGFMTASRFVYATAREGSLPRAFGSLNSAAVPWLPVVGIAGVSVAVALAVAVSDGWKVLIATGAALEAAIYAVAGFCVLRLRSREPGAERPFRVRVPAAVSWAAVGLFALLAVLASLSVDNKTNPLPLLIVLVVGAGSALYVLRGLPRVRAAEEARRAARGTRRPQRAGGVAATPPPPAGTPAQPETEAAMDIPPQVREVSVAEAATMWRRVPRTVGTGGFTRGDRLVALLFAVQLAAAAAFGGVLVHGLRDDKNRTVTLGPVVAAAATNGAGASAAPATPVAAGASSASGAVASGAAHPPTGTQPAGVGVAPGVAGPAGPTGAAHAGATTAPKQGAGTLAPGAPIKVGAIVSQTGVISFRTSALGTKAYVDMVNAAGGIDGHPISLELLDDQLDKNTGNAELQQLMADGVFTLAAFNAPNTEGGLAPFLAANKVPLIGSYGEYDEYHSPYAFAFTANYVHWGYAMGAYLKALGVTRPALLYVDNNDDRANSQIENGFAAGYGSKAAYVAKKQPTDTYQGDSTQMQLQGVDGMATILDTGSYERLLQALGSYAQRLKHVADPEFNVPAITSGDYASEAEGTYVASDLDFVDSANPNVVAYVSGVRQEFGNAAPVDYLGLVGWTDGKILVDALRALHGQYTRPALLKVMEGLGTSYPTGVSAPLRFGGGNRDVNTCIKMGKLTGGKVVQTQDYTCDSQHA
jgi:amino acid transporter/ABC-type branched-subunit amino acid transport system substrate-binding protein